MWGDGPKRAQMLMTLRDGQGVPEASEPRAALERVARELPQTYDAFVDTLGLAPWRRELIVEPLWRFLSGRVPLRIEGYGEGVPRTIVGEP